MNRRNVAFSTGWFGVLRIFQRGVMVAALVLSLAACAALATPTPEPKGGGGTFRVVLPAEPASLNPNLRADDPAFIIAQNLFNKLVTLDADYRVIPDLSENWTVSEDRLTYTFQLAKDVRWHDGRPCTSADVKWTFETIVQGKGIAQQTLSHIADIQTPNEATVILTLKEPWAPFLATLAWYGTFILPKHLYEGSDWTTNPANEKPIGTGPFQFSEWVKGERIVLTANTRYFRRGPFLDQIMYVLVKDSATSADMLVKGEVDYLLVRPPAERLAELQRAEGVSVHTFPHPARYYMGFNLRRKPFDDVRVRKAINMAIHRTELVERALLGYGAPAVGFYTPAIPWAYNPQAQVPAFDIAGAEKLLDEAGWRRGPDGTRLKLTLVTINFSPFNELANELQRQLRSVGIETEVILLPPNEWTQRVIQAHDFDMAMTDGTHGPDPDNLNTRFGSSGAHQFMGYSSPEFDAAVTEGAGKTELKERAQAYFRAQEILARDLPLAPLAEWVQFIIVRDKVTGLPQMEARGLVTFNNYSLVRVAR